MIVTEEVFRIEQLEGEINVVLTEESHQVELVESVLQIEQVESDIKVVTSEEELRFIEVAPIILEKTFGGLKKAEPIGEINGINRNFTAPEKFALLLVYRNGLLLSKPDDYVELDDQTIEFVNAPLDKGFIDKLQIIYRDK